MSIDQQVQESAERIEKLEVQRREIQWRIVMEQRNYERLRTLERFETERSILAAKQASPNEIGIKPYPNGRYATKENGGV